ncbi:hypothetical protein [Cellulomonas terrae]|uniref:Uncharacterized protein n=1 Tax=Cellulomonas terrae TaxID=311234 RepID=A0A511JLQ6_9CELL|nr:hypothetical protein [Cellulomonas terrae]GEL98845.1 hypothetical protein CTE05_23920 [Cellulomonas terrae]
MNEPETARPENLVPPAWRDELVLALRLRDVTGARIGDILAEVDEFCADAGLDAPTAFGAPVEYARELTTGSTPTRTGLLDDLRTAGRVLVGFVGLMVVLGSVGTDGPGLVVTVGWVLALPFLLAATIVTVRAAGRTGGHGGWSTRVTVVLVVAGSLAGAVTLGLVLDTPVATVPDGLAAAVGVTLLVGDAVIGTVRARRRPTADLVTEPGTDPVEVRRRNVRADTLTAWLLPGFAVVGVAVLLALDALLDRVA